jgi:hypothetical protein
MPQTHTTAQTDKTPRRMSGRIGAVLKVLATLILHARTFAANAKTRVAVPEFATAAALFGTYDLATIQLRMRRGLLRALALRDYLHARARRGGSLRFAWKPRVELPPNHPFRLAQEAKKAERAKQPRRPRAKPRGPDPALLDPDDPRAYYMPTPEEFAAEVRRRPIGLTITYICLDLGIAPGLCKGDFWYNLERTFRRYGGNLDRMYKVRFKREITFEKERDRRPDTWHIDWRDLRDATVRRALGYLIGELPLDGMDGLDIVPS